MIVLFELIALSGLIWGLVLFAQWVGKHQKMYFSSHPSKTYLKGKKEYNNKSVWRLPLTAPVLEVGRTSSSVAIEGDVLTQFGVCNVSFVLHARIADPRIASTYVHSNVFDADEVFFNCYSKIKAVLQTVLNEGGNSTMAYSPQLHALATEKFKEFCTRHGLELEEISFALLELKTNTEVEVQVEPRLLNEFNSGDVKVMHL